MRAWIDVAVLAKSKNLNGRFVVQATAGLPFLLEEGDTINLVPPKLDVPRIVTVKSIEAIDDNRAEVTFEEVDTPEIASELVGMHCLIRRDLIDDSSLMAAPALWEGWPVIDSQIGMVGTLVGVIENPGQALLEVSREGESVLVPFVDEIVNDVDIEQGVVRVTLPNGLLDL